MVELFDYLNSINDTKKDIMIDEASERVYQPFVINMLLSRNQDCVMLVNELNYRSSIPNKAQYLFLLNALPKKKRYAKKIDSEREDTVIMIMKFYGVNRTRAKEYQKLFSSEQLEEMKMKTNEGGIVKRGKNKLYAS